MYPPRFRVVIGCFPPANPLPARFQFTGAKEEVVFDVVLRPQSAPPTAGKHALHLFIIGFTCKIKHGGLVVFCLSLTSSWHPKFWDSFVFSTAI